MKSAIEELQEYATDWKKRKEIIPYLQGKGYRVDERWLRTAREQWNKDYCDGYRDTYFAYSNKGYKITVDPEEIRDCIRQDVKRGLKHIVRGHQALRKLSDESQITLFPSDIMDSFEILLRSEL